MTSGCVLSTWKASKSLASKGRRLRRSVAMTRRSLFGGIGRRGAVVLTNTNCSFLGSSVDGMAIPGGCTVAKRE